MNELFFIMHPPSQFLNSHSCGSRDKRPTSIRRWASCGPGRTCPLRRALRPANPSGSCRPRAHPAPLDCLRLRDSASGSAVPNHQSKCKMIFDLSWIEQRLPIKVQLRIPPTHTFLLLPSISVKQPDGMEQRGPGACGHEGAEAAAAGGDANQVGKGGLHDERACPA